MSKKPKDHKLIRLFFFASGLTTFVLGSSLLFAPGDVTNIFLDTPVSESGLFFIRFAGTSLLGFSLLNIYALNKSEEFLRLASVVNIVSLFPATFISLWTYGGLGYIDDFQWLIVAEHLFFFGGFAACLIALHPGIMPE